MLIPGLRRTVGLCKSRLILWRNHKPRPRRASPPALSGPAGSRVFRGAVIGLGAQGSKQCAALKALRGIQICGIAERDSARLANVSSSLGLPKGASFTDARDMLTACGSLDFVSIATTAPSHLSLARLAIEAKVPQVFIEKPLAVSLQDAAAFIDECRESGVTITVNYSRRWVIDYLAIRRYIKRGCIGIPNMVSIVAGQGGLAMNASHYFDLCCFLLDDRPSSVYSKLSMPSVANPRGPDYADPVGYSIFTFSRGARCFVDFSPDYARKVGQIAIAGTDGSISVDESLGSWTLHGSAGRSWTFGFAEPLKAQPLFARVVTETLSKSKASFSDGMDALHMAYGSWISSQGGTAVALPLPDTTPDLPFVFA